MKKIQAQSGVAIITALLIVALATVISVKVATSLQLEIRRTGNMIGTEQAYLYTIGTEDWARKVLYQDQKDNKVDSLDEDWTTEILPIPVEGGYIQGYLTDLQGCFNINSIYTDNKINMTARTRFEQLLTVVGLDTKLSQSLIDWLDEDLQTTIPEGAEDLYYNNLQKPYRTASGPMFSTSELRLIKGFEKNEDFEKLQPFICAFGVDASININTAPAEVLRSISMDLSDADVDQIIEERKDNPFMSVTQFTTFNPIKNIKIDIDGLSINSNYFLLNAKSEIGQGRVQLYSVIHRNDNGKTNIIMRSQGAY